MDSKARGIDYPWGSHRCGGRRDPVAVVTGHVIGVLLDIDELGLVCWVLFTLAIYALPVFVGLTRTSIQFKLEQDPFGAIIVGFVADGTTLVSGQCAVSVALLHPPLSRWIAVGACCDTSRP